jgi:hypothetical protein
MNGMRSASIESTAVLKALTDCLDHPDEKVVAGTVDTLRHTGQRNVDLFAERILHTLDRFPATIPSPTPRLHSAVLFAVHNQPNELLVRHAHRFGALLADPDPMLSGRAARLFSHMGLAHADEVRDTLNQYHDKEELTQSLYAFIGATRALHPHARIATTAKRFINKPKNERHDLLVALGRQFADLRAPPR